MDRRFGLSVSAIAMVLAMLVPRLAAAQEEIPPPAGKGPLVVVLSGAGGSGSIRDNAVRIAGLGYDVVLFDSSNLMAGRKGRTLADTLKAAIAQARQMPNALPGKIGLVGFSLGGLLAIPGVELSDDVAVVALWYPVTSEIKDVAAAVGRIKVPVVMFAGTNDDYKFCCTIGKAREIASAAQAANAPFELTTYPGVGHAFAQTTSAASYSRASTDDAFARTAAALKRYLGN